MHVYNQRMSQAYYVIYLIIIVDIAWIGDLQYNLKNGKYILMSSKLSIPQVFISNSFCAYIKGLNVASVSEWTLV